MGQTVRATGANRSSTKCQHYRDASSCNFRPTASCVDALISPDFAREKRYTGILTIRTIGPERFTRASVPLLESKE